MLAHTDTTTCHKSDGTDEEIPLATLFLPDYHREYTSAAWENDRSRPYRDATNWYNADVVWNEMDVMDTIVAARSLPNDGRVWDNPDVDKAKRRIFNTLFSPVIDSDEADQTYVWKLTGTLKGLSSAYGQLIEELDCTPGGDDDFFDYWPNSMDVLWQLALDLDGWDAAGNDHCDIVRTLAKRVWDRVGPNAGIGEGPDLRTEWDGHEWYPKEVSA